jgi:hypothetical protein
MIDASTDPRHNQLLAALPEDQLQRWLPTGARANAAGTSAL